MNLLNDAIQVAMFLSIVPLLIFLSYLIDLRLSPEPLRIESGSGRKRRSSAQLEIVDRSQTG